MSVVTRDNAAFRDDQIIDAHMHIWDRTLGDEFVAERYYPSLVGREFLVADYDSVRSDLGMDRAVLVHGPATVKQTLACLDVAESRPDLFVHVIGWIDLSDVGSRGVIRQLRRRPAFRGVRYVGLEERDDNNRAPQVEDGVLESLADAGLVFEVLAPPHLLRWIRETAERFPRLRIVIDAMGLPGWGGSDPDLWSREVTSMREHANISIKLAGLYESAGRVVSAVEAVERTGTVLAAFGPDRVMFATNWPVVEGVASSALWLDAVRCCLDELGLDDADRELVLRGAALRTFEPPADADAAL